MKKYHSFPGLVLASALMSFSASSGAEELQDISLQFVGEFGGLPFDCDAQYENVGISKATVGVSDFRLYVSRIRLLDANGAETAVSLLDHGPWQHDGIALLDFEDGSGNCSNGTSQINGEIRAQVPAGDYSGVAFDIGVPFESNHQDPTLAASPLNLTALFWNWRGGYRFLRVDLLPDNQMTNSEASMPTDAPVSQQGKTESVMSTAGSEKQQTAGTGMAAKVGAGWALHVGSTGCMAESPTSAPEQCSAANRIIVEFPDADPLTSVFVIDPAQVLTGSDVSRNTEGTSPGCMSAPDDPECRAVFQALGLSSDKAVQSLVSVR